jgi:phosphoglycerate dehydrogenase-like enzyme
MNMMAYDTFPDQNLVPSPRFQFTTLENVLIRSDIISFHCPEQDKGRAILDRDSIHRLKPCVFLVNTARSSLVDEVGVLEGLIEGRIAGLALDVYDREPPIRDRSLRMIGRLPRRISAAMPLKVCHEPLLLQLKIC